VQRLVVLLACVVVVGVSLWVGWRPTVLGGFQDSGDGKYRVYARLHGAFGRSFVKRTEKVVRIDIVMKGAKEKLLLKEEYRVTAANLGWNGWWDSSNNLTVVMFEYPRGMNRETLGKVATNNLRTLTFQFDPRLNAFRELADSK
jgi:hypothetical protein